MISKWILSLLSLFILSSCGWLTVEEEPVSPTEPIEEVEEPVEDETTDEKETNEEDTADDEQQVNQELSAWIPRLENVVYSYEGSGSEFAAFNWNPQFNQENYYQIVRNNGGTVMAEVYEYSETEITRTFTRSETYFRDNFTDIGAIPSETDEEIYLKTPIQIGTTWESADATYEITDVDKEMTVPLDTYETIEVTITYPDSTTRRYYAENVGLVYEVHDSDDFTVESSLVAIETDTPESLLVNIFVPDEQAMGMDTVNAVINLATNDPARLAIQDLLSGQHPDYPAINVLPPETSIQYLFLNNDNVVEVDVSEEFETNMNAGSTGELFYIYTLVNTLSQYYGTDDVLLTVDGEPFEGGHLIAEEGETFKFNEEMVNP